MHFPSKDIAKALDMVVETPFLRSRCNKIFQMVVPISKKINLKRREKIWKMDS